MLIKIYKNIEIAYKEIKKDVPKCIIEVLYKNDRYEINQNWHKTIHNYYTYKDNITLIITNITKEEETFLRLKYEEGNEL